MLAIETASPELNGERPLKDKDFLALFSTESTFCHQAIS